MPLRMRAISRGEVLGPLGLSPAPLLLVGADELEELPAFFLQERFELTSKHFRRRKDGSWVFGLGRPPRA